MGPLDRLFEGRDVDGLREMFNEARLAAFLDVGLHPVAAERNSPQTKIAAQCAHEFVTVAVGQSEIGDDEVERFLSCNFQGFCDAVGAFDPMPAAPEETRERLARGLMIFHEQDVQWPAAGRRRGHGRGQDGGGFGHQWQFDVKRGSLIAPGTFRPDPPAMFVDEQGRDGKAEAEPAKSRGLRFRTLREGDSSV